MLFHLPGEQERGLSSSYSRIKPSPSFWLVAAFVQSEPFTRRRNGRRVAVTPGEIYRTVGDPCLRHCQVGSLAGAAQLLNDNTGVLRLAQ